MIRQKEIDSQIGNMHSSVSSEATTTTYLGPDSEPMDKPVHRSQPASPDQEPTIDLSSSIEDGELVAGNEDNEADGEDSEDSGSDGNGRGSDDDSDDKPQAL